MNDIDKTSRAVLPCDAVAGGINIARDALAVIRGRHRWLVTTMFIINLVVFACVVLAAMRFCDPADLTMQLRWGGMALSLMLVLVVTIFKIWFWVEMHINPVAPLL